MSCEKTEVDLGTVIDFQGLILKKKDGALHFQDRDQFLQFIEHYQKGTKEWELLLEKFDSMERYINQISEADLDMIDQTGEVGKYKNQLVIVEKNGEKYIEPTIGSTLFRKITNKSGDFVIGDTLIHLAYDRVLYIPMKEYDGKKSYESMAIRIENIIKRDITPTISIRSSESKSEVYCNSSSGTRRRKLKAFLEENKIMGAQFFTFAVRHYKRGLFGSWNGDNAEEISINGSVDLLYTLYPHTGGPLLTHKYYDLELNNSKEFDDLILYKDYYNYITPYVKMISWEGTNLNLKADESSSSDCHSHPTIEFDWIF